MGLVGGANLVERVVEAEVAANSAAERVVEQGAAERGVVANSVDSARVAVVD